MCAACARTRRRCLAHTGTDRHREALTTGRSGIQPALHRLRHGVATYLVGTGKLLKAQARLGHRDAATTLRHYSHATPLDDQDIADDLDALLNQHQSGPATT
ncbi:hypothetical protein I6A60_13840 [Frankia sp. AgB1.9]|uniref:hypothetical protein n=1 Tax=unclassified Frankia TaxID=2632575 RepID=UPI001933980E|nr:MULTISPECIES: hypothetical protein [unclassified Frankia]MBL7548952.1 hypothetical protein [Frankia sp. AgB1.9]MBL7620655.1 hypothetical protein [Frankia sp. AgB1.8]